MTELAAIPTDAPKRFSRWKHYKGGTYMVLSIGRHTDDGQFMVIYTDGTHVWCRPLVQWDQVINLDCVRRFTEIP